MPFNRAHSGGYNEVTASKVKNVALPDKICCSVCKKWKSAGQFSNKQLQDLRFKIVQFGPLSGPGSGGTKCRNCTGQQVTELTCIMCDEVKPLTDFAKTHRRDPDNARCTMCIEEQATLLPGLEDVESDKDSDESDQWDTTEASTAQSDGGAPLTNQPREVTSGLNSLSLAQYNSMVGGSENFRPTARVAASVTSGIKSVDESGVSTWAESERAEKGNVYMEQTHDKQGKAFTGYDSTGIAHSRYRAPSTAASTQSVAERSYGELEDVFGTREKFPKPSRKINTPVPTEKPDLKKKGYNLPDEDEDEDDDDEDYVLGAI